MSSICVWTASGAAQALIDLEHHYPNHMDRNVLLRRLVHLSAPVFLIYYFLPSPLWEGAPPNDVLLLLAFSMAMAFELARLVIGFKVPGMRWYESTWISASAWAAMALTFTLLFFPLEYAAPVVVGMAVIDPVIGTVRKTEYYPWLPFALHLAIMVGFLALLTDMDVQLAAAAVVSSILAIVAEGAKSNYLDDDFLMIVVPLISLSLIAGL